MFRIDNTTAAASQPTPAIAGTEGFFTGGNPSTGIPAATIVSADWANMIQEELVTFISAAGAGGNAIARSKTATGQVLGAVKRLFAGNVSGSLTTSATLTLDQAGLVVVDCTGGSVTLTLPAANAMLFSSFRHAIRYRFCRLDSSGNTLTIQRAGSDTIDGTSATSMTIAAAGRATLDSDGTSIWFQTASTGVTGVALLGSANAFTAGNTFAAASAFNGSTTFTKAVAATTLGVTFATPLTISLITGCNFSFTATSNFTLNLPTGGLSGQSGTIMITQDGTGSRVVTFASGWVFPGGIKPTLSTGAASVDVLNYLVLPNGNVAAQLQKGFA